MTIKLHIGDGEGTGLVAGVTESHALKVQVLPQSSRGVAPEDLSNLRQLREYLTDGTGSSAMNVNGGVTPVEFSVDAEVGITRWITGMRILMEGADLEINTNDFRRFGQAATGALAVGVEIEADQAGAVTAIASEPIVYLGDFLNYADEYTNLVNSVSSQSDFISFIVRFDAPIVLTEGSSDRLLVRINDDLTAIDSFQCIARGYQEFL